MSRRDFLATGRVWALGCAALGASAAASAGPAGAPPDYGFQWATIGAPGNRPTNPEEVPNNDFLRIGAVDHTYRLAKTEVSGAQWFEFVRAYAPFVGSAFNSMQFVGGAIHFSGFGPGGVPTYVMSPGFENRQAGMGWRYAARYANWLHNNKALTRDAFEAGAYDTSTFGALPDGTLTDQATHAPGARFWIPTLDEWIKAAFYDPTKNGGAGGYWMQPGQSDAPLVSGLPGDPGAQTGAGVSAPPYPYGVALYHELGPWGLFDMSGGAHEWTETLDLTGKERFVKGSQTGQGWGYEIVDRIDRAGSTTPDQLFGFRLASAVPAPSSALLFAFSSLAINSRRRTRCP